jgi:hypothetical protein
MEEDNSKNYPSRNEYRKLAEKGSIGIDVKGEVLRQFRAYCKSIGVTMKFKLEQ